MSAKRRFFPTPTKPVTSTSSTPNDSMYYCARSRTQLAAIKEVVKILKKPLQGRDNWKLGSVYIIEERNSEYVKVGFTAAAELERAQSHINECELTIQRIYMTPAFRGAYRAEKISHKLMAEHNFHRYGCACRKKKQKASKHHHEFFKRSYEDAVATVLLVCDWMRHQMPYSPLEMEDMYKKMPGDWKAPLKQTWVECLEHWLSTQYEPAPRDWRDFFWRYEAHWRGYTISSTPKLREKRTPEFRAGDNNPWLIHTTRPLGSLTITDDAVVYNSTQASLGSKIYASHSNSTGSSECDIEPESKRGEDFAVISRGSKAIDLRETYAESPCPSPTRGVTSKWSSEESFHSSDLPMMLKYEGADHFACDDPDALTDRSDGYITAEDDYRNMSNIEGNSTDEACSESSLESNSKSGLGADLSDRLLPQRNRSRILGTTRSTLGSGTSSDISEPANVTPGKGSKLDEPSYYAADSSLEVDSQTPGDVPKPRRSSRVAAQKDRPIDHESIGGIPFRRRTNTETLKKRGEVATSVEGPAKSVGKTVVSSTKQSRKSRR